MQVTQVSSCPKCAQWDWDESAGKWASIFLGERGRPRKRKPGYISWPTFKLCVYYVPLLGFTTTVAAVESISFGSVPLQQLPLCGSQGSQLKSKTP